jgi:hypothetical protein
MMNLKVTLMKTKDDSGFCKSESWVYYDLETVEQLNEVTEKILIKKESLRKEGFKVETDMEFE